MYAATVVFIETMPEQRNAECLRKLCAKGVQCRMCAKELEDLVRCAMQIVRDRVDLVGHSVGHRAMRSPMYSEPSQQLEFIAQLFEMMARVHSNRRGWNAAGLTLRELEVVSAVFLQRALTHKPSLKVARELAEHQLLIKNCAARNIDNSAGRYRERRACEACAL
jgi:hypothetical protein